MKAAMDISIVVGNPKAGSRTLKIAQQVAGHCAEHCGGAQGVVVDLAEYASELFDWPNQRLAELGARVAASDLLIVGSPTYKATYTGLLKAFFDRYPHNGLDGVIAVPVMTAGSDLHGMAVEVMMRPLLVELGASIPTRGLFVNMQQMGDVDAVIRNWASDNLPKLKLSPAAGDLNRRSSIPSR